MGTGHSYPEGKDKGKGKVVPVLNLASRFEDVLEVEE
jgi:hypothetical protein